jgi:DNA-binding IclR family transcriptional regulator
MTVLTARHLAVGNGASGLSLAASLAGGVAAPTVPVAAESTPLGQVLISEHRGVLVGPQRALDGVACAAAALHVGDEPAGSLAVCAPAERFAMRREVYARAVGATQKRVSRAVLL